MRKHMRSFTRSPEDRHCRTAWRKAGAADRVFTVSHTSCALFIPANSAWCPSLVCEFRANDLIWHHMFSRRASLVLVVGNVVLSGCVSWVSHCGADCLCGYGGAQLGNTRCGIEASHIVTRSQAKDAGRTDMERIAHEVWWKG